MDFSELDEIRYKAGFYLLDGWCIYSVTGTDRERFIQGQVTNDVFKIRVGESLITARADSKGLLKSFFFLHKKQDEMFLFGPSFLSDFAANDLEAFVISDDVTFTKKYEGEVTIVLGPLSKKLESKVRSDIVLPFDLYGEKAVLIAGNVKDELKEHCKHVNAQTIDQLRILSGWPDWKIEVEARELVNNSYLGKLAVNYDKGCFLGQETLAKVNRGRGPAYFPALVELIKPHEIKSKNFDLNKLRGSKFEIEGRLGGTFIEKVDFKEAIYLRCQLYRDFRIEGKQVSLDFGTGENVTGSVINFPYFKDNSNIDKAKHLFEMATKNYIDATNDFRSVELLKLAIELNPSFSDAYEILGAIYGQMGDFKLAIDYMKELLAVDPSSIMAHTNLSLYYMKMGMIDEAEEEKSKAIVKSFELHGKEANLKKEMMLEKQKKLQELEKRELMFKEVLAIDEDDVMANYGLGDIALQRQEILKAITFFEKVLKFDPKYSVAYLGLGKAYELNGNLEKANEIYQQGTIEAARKGDMMPANEMQVRLNNLKKYLNTSK